MTKVLVLAEHHQGAIAISTLVCIGAAKKLAARCDVLLACEDEKIANDLAAFSGIESVLFLKKEINVAEDYAPVLSKISRNYTHVLAPATTFGKNILPRVAATLDVMQISDVVEIENENTFVRPIYAGNAYVKLRSLDPIKLMTIRPTAFEAVERSEKAAPIIVLNETIQPFAQTQFESLKASAVERPELATAKIVVAGGRGLKQAENFKMLEQLADCLNAAIGASRAAVDAGFVPNDYQVGQTGKVIAPNLYIAIGISGAIQHLAGIMDSKLIVAINQDADAPIFQVADYGLVGDLFKIIPELMYHLR